MPRTGALAGTCTACPGVVVAAVVSAQPSRPTAPAAPAATEKVADAPQPGWGRKFSAENTRPTVTIANPYMDPARPYGPAALAYFQQSRHLCFAPDGTAYVNDDWLIRRVDTAGQAATWAF